MEMKMRMNAYSTMEVPSMLQNVRLGGWGHIVVSSASSTEYKKPDQDKEEGPEQMLGDYSVERIADMQLSCDKVRVAEQGQATVRLVPELHGRKIASSLRCQNADVDAASEMPPDVAWFVSWRILHCVLGASSPIALVRRGWSVSSHSSGWL
jgi:hypothetical protein